MVALPLLAIPSQSLSTTQNQVRYVVTIKDLGDSVAVTISINEVEVISGLEAVAGALLIPYRYIENGNFQFITNDDEIPNYTRFGIDQFLVFTPQSELSEARGD